jgi:autotransporter-associated beta strand protein
MMSRRRWKQSTRIERSRSTKPFVERLDDRLAPAALNGAGVAIDPTYGKLPIRFEPNVGQSAAQVQFLAQGGGSTLFLTADSAVLRLTNAADSTGTTLAMNLVGADPLAQAVGEELLPGTSSYFVGNDPSQWHTNIANYGQVAYQDVYPGVNLVYYGTQQQLEYDFVVAPGADPSRIGFAVQGADSVALDAQGNLVLHTSNGDVIQHAPVLYQVVDGAKVPVDGQFVIRDGNQIGFQVGDYDRDLPLTIDPVLTYATYVGGSQSDLALGVAVDGAGNAYVTGYGQSTDFPITPGSFRYDQNADFANHAYVAKLNATGTAYLYTVYVAGNGTDNGLGIAVDSNGDAIVVGATTSTDLPTTAGAVRSGYSAGGSDGFAFKLNPTGTALVYSTYLGGTGFDEAEDVAVDASGNAYVTGEAGAGFPTTAGAFQTLNSSTHDIFVAALNPTGVGLIYGTYLGGASLDFGSQIAVDAAGDAYVTGITQSFDYPVTAGAFQSTNPNVGLNHVIVSKLNPTGSALLYSTLLAGNGSDTALGLAVDAAGDAYVTGTSSSTNFPVTDGAFQKTDSGLFVTKLNPTGTALVYSTFLGAGGFEIDVAVDGAGDAVVAGYTNSASFPVTANSLQPTKAGDPSPDDSFVTKLNETGSGLVYSSYFGGNGDDDAHAIAVDGSGNVYVVGGTGSTDLATPGAVQTTYDNDGFQDGFVAKFNLGPAISSVSPNTAVAGSAAFTLTINGSALDPLATVQWNGTPLVVTKRVGSSQIQATVPAALIATQGTANISVTNPGGAPAANATFTVLAPTTTTVTLGAEFAGGAVTYDGAPHGAAAGWISTGTDGGSGALTVTYVGVNGTTYGSSATPPTNPGNYLASATFAGDATHASSSGSVSFTILPVVLNWIGSSSPGGDVWSNAAAWSPALVPQSQYTLTFDTTVAGFDPIDGFTSIDDLSGLVGLTLLVNDASSQGDFTISGANVIGLTGGLTTTISNGASATIAVPIALGQSESFTINNSTTISGTISGSSASTLTVLAKAGPSPQTLLLSGTNTFDGNVSVASGILAIANATALGSAVGKTTVASGAELDLVGTISVTGEIASVAGAGATGLAAIQSIGGDNTWAGAVQVTATNTRFGASSGTLTVSGVVSSTAGLAAPAVIVDNSGTGQTYLTGANTFATQFGLYAGPLSISSFNSVSTNASLGTVHATSSNLGAQTASVNGTIQLGCSTAPPATLIYVGAGETTDRVLNLNGGTVGATLDQSGTGLLRFTSPMTSSAGQKTLTLQGSTIGIGRLDGAVPDSSAGATSLVKAGTGTWILAGNNTYSGGTTVSSGTLLVNGSLNSVSSVSVAPGATLGGSGAVGTVASGGTVDSGASGTPGTLSTGALTLHDANGAGTLHIDIGATSTYDKIVSTGVIDISGASLVLSVNPAGINPGDRFVFLSGTSITGAFNGGSSVTVGSETFDIVYGASSVSLVLATSASLVGTILNGAGSGYANGTLVPGYINSTLAQQQHSMVENIVYSFSSAVSLSASNFSISGLLNSGTTIVPMLNVSTNAANTVWTVTFAGPGVNTATHSIGDGEYELTLSGVSGLTNSTYDFYRLMGDMNGDGTVNISDFSTMVGTYLRATTDLAYLGADDLDGDGTIGVADVSALVGNFLHTVPTLPPN